MSRARREAAHRAARRRRLLLWGGVGGVIVVAAVVAAIVGSSGGKSTTPAGVRQVRPVHVTGEPLPAPAGADGADQGIGKLIPSISGQSFDGKGVTIAPDGRAKVIVVVAHWCPHCQREMPLLANYLRSNPPPADVDVLTVATDTTPRRPNYPPSTWLESIRWPALTLADDASGTAGQALGLPGFPYFVAVDKNGMMLSRASGEIGVPAFAALISRAAGSP